MHFSLPGKSPRIVRAPCPLGRTAYVCLLVTVGIGGHWLEHIAGVKSHAVDISALFLVGFYAEKVDHSGGDG
jgi:hypothetical protein